MSPFREKRCKALGGFWRRVGWSEIACLEGRWERPGSTTLSRRRLRPLGVGPVEDKAARLAAVPRTLTQNHVPMIRISFETRTNSEDHHRPNAWRREAAAKLREIAKRIAAGEAMPLVLFNPDGKIIGKARELSYQPEPARQSAVKLPFGS